MPFLKKSELANVGDFEVLWESGKCLLKFRIFSLCNYEHFPLGFFKSCPRTRVSKKNLKSPTISLLLIPPQLRQGLKYGLEQKTLRQKRRKRFFRNPLWDHFHWEVLGQRDIRKKHASAQLLKPAFRRLLKLISESHVAEEGCLFFFFLVSNGYTIDSKSWSLLYSTDCTAKVGYFLISDVSWRRYWKEEKIMTQDHWNYFLRLC